MSRQKNQNGPMMKCPRTESKSLREPGRRNSERTAGQPGGGIRLSGVPQPGVQRPNTGKRTAWLFGSLTAAGPPVDSARLVLGLCFGGGLLRPARSIQKVQPNG